MEANPYLEARNGGYYVAGTRIGLDTVVYAFRRGRCAEDIFEAYPSIGSLAKVYSVITFILEHPTEISSYLADQDQLFEEIKRQNPMPQDLIDRFEQGKEEVRFPPLKIRFQADSDIIRKSLFVLCGRGANETGGARWLRSRR